MSTSSSGSPGSSTGTLLPLPPDIVPGDSGLAADAQTQDRARLQAYQQAMSDLDKHRTSVSDMQAYEKATQQEIDDLQQEIQSEMHYLTWTPNLPPSKTAALRSAIQGQLTLIRQILQQREALSNTEAQKAKLWGQQYAGIAPYPPGTTAPVSSTAPSSGSGWNGGSSSSAATTPVSGANHDVLASHNAGAVSSAAKIPVSSVTYDPNGFASGRAAFINYVNQALNQLGITNPQARQNWMNGLLTAAARESSYNPAAINLSDSNAAAGDPSRGLMQTIPGTFAAYHQPGTSTNIYNPVANIAAAINYVTTPTTDGGRYGVNRNGSNLAALVPQFNPNDAPQGY